VTDPEAHFLFLATWTFTPHYEKQNERRGQENKKLKLSLDIIDLANRHELAVCGPLVQKH
jgi:hypothetical protein